MILCLISLYGINLVTSIKQSRTETAAKELSVTFCSFLGIVTLRSFAEYCSQVNLIHLYTYTN